MYFQLIILIVAIYVALKRTYHHWLSKKWGCEPIPKLKYGFLGIPFLKLQVDINRLGRILEDQANIFNSINKHTFSVRILHKRLITTYNAENMKALVASQFNDFGIGPRKQALYPLIGHGVFSSDGQRWKASREMLRPQFSREKVGHIQTLEPHIQNVINIIKRSNGEIIDLQEYFHKMTMDAASEFLFGESTNTLLSEKSLHDEEFNESFLRLQDVVTQRIAAGPLAFIVSGKQFKKDLAVVHNLVQRYIDKALNTPVEDFDKLSKEGYVLLYEIAKKTNDRKVIQDELLAILLAGRNTTAGLLSFLFFELARNPHIYDKLKSEIDQQFGSGDNVQLDLITFESMKRCSYLKYCINEALRLYPPIPRNLRVALKDTTIPKGGGEQGEAPVFIPKGTHVTFSIYSCHRQKDVYGEDVDSFRPERWENLKPGWSFMPFGSGPRVCLGQQFALTEASYVTIRLLQNFAAINNCDKEYPPRRITNATTRLLNGCQCQFKVKATI